MMGSGKSTIGKHLASILSYAFVDTDEYIIDNFEFDSISEIFETKGEAYFRTLEKRVLEELKNIENTVIATGGGIIVDSENSKKLKEMGEVIYLKLDVDVLLTNLSNSSDRPLLKNVDMRKKLQSLLDARRFKYINSANIVFHVKEMEIEEISREIINFCYKLIY